MAALTKAQLAELDNIFEKYVKTEGKLLSLLFDAQQVVGYLPPAVLTSISRKTRVPLSEIYGTITFYSGFHLEPHGKNTIRVCRGTACHVRRGKDILKKVEEQVGVKESETTSDFKFSVETAACLGTCASAPVMVVNKNYYGKLTPDRVKSILKQYS